MILLIILCAALAHSPVLVAAEGKKTEPSKSAPHSHEEHGDHEEEKHNEHEGHGKHEEENHDEHEEHGKHAEKEHKEEKHAEHKEEKHEGHDEHEEGESKIGHGKGIEAASEESGIKLSPQAIKTFEVTTQKVMKLPITLPEKAFLFLADDVEIYRLRDGFFKRIDFKKINNKQLLVTSDDLAVGDEIVTGGVSFIRIAEIAAFGGAPEGHSH